ncbi:ABC transporter ATP-binding protein [Undibacterium squillarum]|uniref:GTPase n=1 Tax=Undibacterium squillarum TaxID=1131567 RepID=A0ABQ2Y551_9BURK|nr:ATP-binding cassette domain-containing protein [Undibacterium squillarum]GGX54455.1 GTPase [Undibacterium squillarum]
MIEIRIQHPLTSADGADMLKPDLQIAAQQSACLSGASGAGKTTLLRIIAGLLKPQQGFIRAGDQVWLDTERGICLPPQQRRVGMVFQDYALFPHMTVQANIAYALARSQPALVTHLLQLTGLQALAQRKPAQLSGGQQQRVALARALARIWDQPGSLLLLDEPLSALDAETRSQLQDVLQQAMQQSGCTSLLVSHDMAEIFRLCQQVFVLEHGRIARSGSPEQVFLQGGQAGQLTLQAQVLAVRREEVVYVLSLLIGQEVTEVFASAEQAAGLRPGDRIAVAVRSITPLGRAG